MSRIGADLQSMIPEAMFAIPSLDERSCWVDALVMRGARVWGDKSKMHLGQGVDIGGWCGEEPWLMDLWAKFHGREVAGP
jgi:hypothetical protein